MKCTEKTTYFVKSTSYTRKMFIKLTTGRSAVLRSRQGHPEHASLAAPAAMGNYILTNVQA
jgi:hypothetical protein